MPTLDELRRRYEKEHPTTAPHPGSAEVVEPDTRADLSPTEIVDQKLRAALLARDPDDSSRSRYMTPGKPR